MTDLRTTPVDRARGQVLVLFALMLIVLLGIAALAIDISGAYAKLRYERAVADTAALSGASDTYRQGSTAVGTPEWNNARLHAMQNLVDELDPTYVPGDALPTCGVDSGPYPSDIVNCPIPGTPYYVSIYAPARTCVTIGGCDALRSVQVTVRTPKHGLSLARLFGQAEWNLPVTSVAERHRGSNYSFVTLRPPKPSRRNDPLCTPDCDANEDDIKLDGNGATLTVSGDMGTNTNMTLNAGATVALDAGSFVDRYDTYKNWSGPPPDRQMPAPIPDPGYPIPAAPDPGLHPALQYTDPVAAHLSGADCTTEVGNIPAAYLVDPAEVATGQVVCLKPGRYAPSYPWSGPAYASVTTYVLTTFASSDPTYPSYGVYFLDGGFMPGSNTRVIGGYTSGAPGVGLVFLTTCSPACTFAGNAVDLLALNAGTAYPTGFGVAPTAAVNWDGTLVRTTGRVPRPMTLMVRPDPVCVVGPIEPDNSCSTRSPQLRLPGGGHIFVFFVQYAPTDNVTISGGSGSDGRLGQIWAWTVQYSGNYTNINLVGAQNPEPGVLRIATPCSPGAICDNPEAYAAIP